MTATLTFTLPEEGVEHLQAVRAGELAGAISDVLTQTRTWLKHGHEFDSPEQALEAIRALLCEVAPLAQGEA